MDRKIFLNADQEIVEYDGSEITWRVSVYALVVRENQVLIIKNKLEKLYDIIGGGIEFGEAIQEALDREAMEEAGAKIKTLKLLDMNIGYFYHRRGTFHQTLQIFYQAELFGDLQKPTESDTEWVGFVDLEKIGKEYKLPSSVEEIIKNNFFKKS